MPSNGRGGKDAERLPIPGLRRPSNPTMVAKAAAPAVRPAATSAKRGRSAKKAGGKAARAPMPASVTMGPARVVRAEEAAREPGVAGGDGSGTREAREAREAGSAAGVLYRLVVSDAEGKPIAQGMFTVRKHVLAVSASGCFAPADPKAQIGVVALDAEGGGVDLVEVTGGAEAGSVSAGAGSGVGTSVSARRGSKGPAVEGELAVFEYFSFELGGVTYAIPQSGFLVVTKRRGRRLEVARTPRPGGSIHGAVVRGLVTDGGADGYSFEL